MEMAESVPTVVINLAFCSSMNETLETADSRGEAIEERRVDFGGKTNWCFYTNCVVAEYADRPVYLGPSCFLLQVLMEMHD
jgi:hypothetical protein